MANVKVVNMQGAAVGEIALSDDIFGSRGPAFSAMHAVVRAYHERAAPGHPERQNPHGGARRRPKDLSPEGHRQCASSWPQSAPVHPRRRRVRARSPAIIASSVPQQGSPPGDEERADQQGCRKRYRSLWTTSTARRSQDQDRGYHAQGPGRRQEGSDRDRRSPDEKVVRASSNIPGRKDHLRRQL